MWIYEKKLQYPVKVGTCNPALAKLLIEQYGGADGELAAALRYLNQRYTIPDKVIGLLTDIGTEEFAHLEMIATMVYKLTKDATPEQMKAAGLDPHYAIMIAHFITIMRLVFHLLQRIYRLKVIQLPIIRGYCSRRKARATYQWLINLSDDPDINDSLRFLREREIVHSQRFREAVEILKEERDKNIFKTHILAICVFTFKVKSFLLKI